MPRGALRAFLVLAQSVLTGTPVRWAVSYPSFTDEWLNNLPEVSLIVNYGPGVCRQEIGLQMTHL